VALLQEVQGSTPVDFIFTKKKDGVSSVRFSYGILANSQYSLAVVSLVGRPLHCAGDSSSRRSSRSDRHTSPSGGKR
jgi:hypothetical protein